jgi:hypothetical protein
LDAGCGAVAGNLRGAAYDMSKSRFAFGSTPVEQEQNGITHWVGADGALAIWPACGSSGMELGVINAGAPETLLADWSSVEQDLAMHVEEYFEAMGLDACQIGAVSPNYGSDGITIVLPRVAGNVPVQPSEAYAHFDADNQTTEEELYWPEIPADTILAAMSFSAMLANPTSLTEYKALLPAAAQGDGQVVIHHSSCTSEQSPPAFISVVTYDVLEEDNSQLGMPEPVSFDISGNPVTLPD